MSVDQDHGLAFPQNKQNENSINIRHPLTGVLVAGANDEIGLDLCTGTTVPLASPCPLLPASRCRATVRPTAAPPGRAASCQRGRASCPEAIHRSITGRVVQRWTFSWLCGVVVYFASLGILPESQASRF